MEAFKVEIPEGYEIDKENSTFENIIFKKIEEGIKPGFWYKNKNQFFYITEVKDGYAYGFGWTFGKYQVYTGTTGERCMSNPKWLKISTLVPDYEAREMLVEKAKEMGYDVGVKIGEFGEKYTIKKFVFPFINDEGETRFYLAGDDRGKGCMIFNGDWIAIKEEEEEEEEEIAVEEKIDFSIHNLTDWFYIETKSGYKFLHRGFLIKKSLSNISYDIDEDLIYNTYSLVKTLDRIAEFRKATPREIKNMYDKHLK